MKNETDVCGLSRRAAGCEKTFGYGYDAGPGCGVGFYATVQVGDFLKIGFALSPMS